MKDGLVKGVDFTGISIVYFCHDGKGRFLMAKRSQNARDEHGRWDIGGGGLEFGSSVEETLKKEIMEEYCTPVLSHDFLGFRDVHRLHNGNKTHWVALDFEALIDPLKAKNGEPHKFEEINWFTLNSLPENLHSQLHVFFEKYKNRLK